MSYKMQTGLRYFKYVEEPWTQPILKATPDDYDFTRPSFKTIISKRHYPPYLNWQQPLLTSNGTVGGSSCAARASSDSSNGDERAYRAFEGDPTRVWCSFDNSHKYGNGQWVEYYTPQAIVPTGFTITNRAESNVIRTFGNFKVQCSNNGTNYDDIGDYVNTNVTPSGSSSFEIKTNKEYKYIRFLATADGILNPSSMWDIYLNIGEIHIDGKIKNNRSILNKATVFKSGL